MEHKNHALENAKAWMKALKENLQKLDEAPGCGTEYYKIIDELYEEPLEVSFRSGWAPKREELAAEEYLILLTTGGPALRITGALSETGGAYDAKLQYQDWFTPWVDHHLEEEDEQALLQYANIIIGE